MNSIKRRRTSKRELDEVLTYWRECPRHRGHYIESSLIDFLEIFTPKQIKGAMYKATSTGRSAYFRYLCGILHNWRVDLEEGRPPRYFDVEEEDVSDLIELDMQKLKNACYDMAKTSMWKNEPVDSATIQAVSDQLERIAIQNTEHVSQLGGDPNLVTRAIHYLNQVQCYPMQEDTSAFFWQLDVLVELSCPNRGIRNEALPFIDDIRSGLSSYEED